MPFDGLRVLALESRRPAEIATLIRNQGGEALVAPSMREVPLENNEDAFRFYEGLASTGSPAGTSSYPATIDRKLFHPARIT